MEKSRKNILDFLKMRLKSLYKLLVIISVCSVSTLPKIEHNCRYTKIFVHSVLAWQNIVITLSSLVL